MTGYLKRLVAKAHGEASGIRPLPRLRFAEPSAAALEPVDVSVEAAPPARPAPSPRTELRRVTARPAATASPADAASPTTKYEVIERRAELYTTRVDEVRGRPRPAPERPARPEPVAKIDRATHEETVASPDPPPQPQAASPEPVAQPVLAIRAAPRDADPPASQHDVVGTSEPTPHPPQIAPPSEPAPTIKVSIGRIELTAPARDAAPPPQERPVAPPARAPVPRRPSLSLDDYLEARARP